jgi:hypothetical protein
VTPVLENGMTLFGDSLFQVRLRLDLTPVPASLELLVRGSLEIGGLLDTGRQIGLMGIAFEIVKRERISFSLQQAGELVQAIRVTALHAGCLPVAFVRKTAIVKERTSIAAIYAAAGAKVRIASSDFPVGRFVCLAGQTPTYAIQRALQEAGGAVRLKGGRLEFLRLVEAFSATEAIIVTTASATDFDSGFLERFEVPAYFSLDANGQQVAGDTSSARTVQFAPGRDAGTLLAMSRVLIHRCAVKIPLSTGIAAGDPVITTSGETLTVITAVHACDYSGASPSLYSKLFLGGLS